MKSERSERILPYAGNINHCLGSLVIAQFLDLTRESSLHGQAKRWLDLLRQFLLGQVFRGSTFLISCCV